MVGKVGGNVALYLCTPELEVVHVVPGNVDAGALLRELEWAAGVWKEISGLPATARRERVRMAHAGRVAPQGPVYGQLWQNGFRTSVGNGSNGLVITADLGSQFHIGQGTVAGTVESRTVLLFALEWGSHGDSLHRWLTGFPLPSLEDAYRTVFEQYLGEQVSDRPVAELEMKNLCRARRLSSGTALRDVTVVRIVK